MSLDVVTLEGADFVAVVVLTAQGKIFSGGADPKQRPDTGKP